MNRRQFLIRAAVVACLPLVPREDRFTLHDLDRLMAHTRKHAVRPLKVGDEEFYTIVLPRSDRRAWIEALGSEYVESDGSALFAGSLGTYNGARIYA